ncbi:MAG TPA: hypothetical protein VGF04_08220 [Solirubrobacterales bacterium]|jgi:hypothetical protein
MSLRLKMSGILAVSFMAAGLVTSDGAAMADSPSRNVLRGHTSQGFKIRLLLKKRTVDVLRFKARLSCRDGSVLLVDESGFLKTPVKHSGSFRDTQFGSTDKVYLRGRVTGRSITGKVRVTDRTRGGSRCHSRWLKFHSAKH